MNNTTHDVVLTPVGRTISHKPVRVRRVRLVLTATVLERSFFPSLPGPRMTALRINTIARAFMSNPHIEISQVRLVD